MKSFHLHIDRIVVEGLPPTAQRQFAGALEERLREWAQSGIADGFAGKTRKSIQSLSAGPLRPGARPDEAAMQIVDSIRQGISARPAKNYSGASKNSAAEGPKHA